MSGSPSPAQRDALRAFEPAFAIHRASGDGSFLLLCEHASANVPARFGNLGLDPAELRRHIGWDLGACALAIQLADALDSPLVHAAHSRLLLDLNRDPAASDSIPAESDGTPIPGNLGLSPAQRQARQRWLYEPFHDAVENLVRARMARGQISAVISIHSFTPVMAGYARPWQVGVLSDRDRRLADLLIEEIGASGDWCIGDNQPYAPADGVYHSLGRHGQGNGLACAMIEVRNDLLADAEGVRRWGALLAGALGRSVVRLQSIRSGSGASGLGRASGGAR